MIWRVDVIEDDVATFVNALCYITIDVSLSYITQKLVLNLDSKLANYSLSVYLILYK